MSKTSTAAIRRPVLLSQLVGQPYVADLLKASLDSDAPGLAHAYLFAGPRGVGKTSTARILARSALCEKGISSEPCGECSTCKEILAGRCPDLIEIDGASHTGVDDVRQIKDEILFPPQKSRFKIYIIDEVHMLSLSAFNALLKTIEEPPEYVIFIFATTDVHKVPLTVQSRCQRYNFSPIPFDELESYVQKLSEEDGYEFGPGAARYIASQSEGSLRDALVVYDQVAMLGGGKVDMPLLEKFMGAISDERVRAFLQAIAAGRREEIFSLTDAQISMGANIDQCVLALARGYGEVLKLHNGAPVSDAYKDVAVLLRLPVVEESLEKILDFSTVAALSPDARLSFNLLLSELCSLVKKVFDEDLLSYAEKLQNGENVGAELPSLEESSESASPKEGSVEDPSEADATQAAEKIKETTNLFRDIFKEDTLSED